MSTGTIEFVDPDTATLAVRTVLYCGLSSWNGEVGRCRWCSAELVGRQTAWCSRNCQWQFEVNHIWRFARKAAKRRAGYWCRREGCGRRSPLEVNHIEPLVGAGYGISCAHHKSNLEALCPPHHQEETNRQRRERAEREAADE